MYKNLSIIVNTRGRIENQFTLKYLTPKLRKQVNLVCFPGEAEGHQINWGDKVKTIIEHPVELTNIGQIRQWSIENFDTDYILFIDDNIVFNKRIDHDPDFGNIRKNPLYEIWPACFTDENIERYQLKMVQDIFDKLNTDEYGMVGMSARFGNNRTQEDFVENQRFYGCLGFNKLLYDEIPNRKFSDVGLKEDFYMMLHFLSNGYKTGCFYKYAMEKVQNANAPGGCSIYRTPEKSNKSAYDLYYMFPKFVKVREKSVKSWNGDFGEKALDVTIYWKKAYQYGLKLREENEKL